MRQGGRLVVVWHRGFRNLDCGANYRWWMDGTAHTIVAQTPTVCCCREARVRVACDTSAATCLLSPVLSRLWDVLSVEPGAAQNTAQTQKTEVLQSVPNIQDIHKPGGDDHRPAPTAIAMPRATKPSWGKQRAQGAFIGPIAPPIPQ